MTRPRSKTYTFTDWGRALTSQVCTVIQSSDTATQSPKGDHYLVLGHCTDDEGTDHSREGPHSIWDPHENAGIAGGNVQVVDVKTYSEAKKTSKSESRTFWELHCFSQLSSIYLVSSTIGTNGHLSQDSWVEDCQAVSAHSRKTCCDWSAMATMGPLQGELRHLCS